MEMPTIASNSIFSSGFPIETARPMLLARRLTLNPVVLLVGVIFWGWLWGIPGTLLAVPLMSSFKIFCDHIEPLAPIGEFLGQ